MIIDKKVIHLSYFPGGPS